MALTELTPEQVERAKELDARDEARMDILDEVFHDLEQLAGSIDRRRNEIEGSRLHRAELVANTPKAPRTWELPPEPGPEVTRLRDGDGDFWTRIGSAWEGGGHSAVAWHELLVFGPLVDATEETTP